MRQYSLPSVDRLLRAQPCRQLIDTYGRALVTAAIRDVLAAARSSMVAAAPDMDLRDEAWIERVRRHLLAETKPRLRPVLNLTGTVLHTNLGRAPLADDAIEAVRIAASRPTALEFDLATGARGERDDHVAALLCQLTGAEAALVVNNNAAAILLALNTLALRKEVPASRGELIEIGGSFRLPEIMTRAGCRLREVGTTNRVHLHDYDAAIGPKTAAVMKIHTSNYTVVGFTASVSESALSPLCRQRGVPLIVDLGSGTLVDLQQYGLPHEPTPAESIRAGADLVTFSGDKLLGGPQAGVIVGRADLVERIARNPLKRALRVDKLTLSALAATLALYLDPDRLPGRLPALRLLTRPLETIRSMAERLRPQVAAALDGIAIVEAVACGSEIGSGALPTRELPSAGLSVSPVPKRGTSLARLAAAFRELPVPILGRLHAGALIFDLRCLEDETDFVRQLPELADKLRPVSPSG